MRYNQVKGNIYTYYFFYQKGERYEETQASSIRYLVFVITLTGYCVWTTQNGYYYPRR